MSDAELARLEEQVRELTRELAVHTEFLSTVGHELRNPLSPIFMQAQYLLDVARQAQGNAVSADWLSEQLVALCSRLRKFLTMLNRITDVSRMSAGQMDLELESVDFSELVRDVAAGFERELSSARSSLHVEAPAQLIGVWDRLRLEQIVSNLVSNAVRYGAGKPIAVTLGAEGTWVRFEVRDHGIGIDPADQQRIFRRFERAGQRRDSGGFGVGLWIVHESCRALGGRVEVQSTLGEGSRFIVKLPRESSG
jgi:signal transduction histidine kinase